MQKKSVARVMIEDGEKKRAVSIFGNVIGLLVNEVIDEKDNVEQKLLCVGEKQFIKTL